MRPDVLHVHSPVLNALPALWVGHRLGVPVVYEIRAFWEDAAVDLGTSRPGGPRYRVTRALETSVLHHPGRIAADSRPLMAGRANSTVLAEIACECVADVARKPRQ